MSTLVEEKKKLAPVDNTALAIGASALVHVVSMLWTIAQEPGTLLPPLGIIVHVIAITVLAASHAVLHLGTRNAAIFMALCVAWEWTWEQINVSYDGVIFGRLAYDDHLAGPKLGDIPIIVPFCFASLIWPSVVIASLLLHDRVCYLISPSPEPLLRTAARCALMALVHTAWSPCVEPFAIAMGVFKYLDTPPEESSDPRGQVGTFMFVPMSEFRGWFYMAFGMIFAFTKMNLPLPAPRRLSVLVDSAPLVLFGMFALWLTLRPLDNIGGLFAMFTMTFSVCMAAYKLSLIAGK